MIVCLTLITISVGDAPVNLGLKINAFPTIAPKIYIHNASMVGYECLLFSVAFYTALRIYQEELGPLRVNWSGVSRLTDILIEGNVVYFFIHMAYSSVQCSGVTHSQCRMGSWSAQRGVFLVSYYRMSHFLANSKSSIFQYACLCNWRRRTSSLVALHNLSVLIP
ncbi:hypothetical protein EDC04DRAFT_1008109 [Pisolithus marmoratus]|nr:hypothetical protein EDC04DRAFT_1008109 [Pisolithus marmoratus]